MDKPMGTAAVVEHALDRARAVGRYRHLTAEDRRRLREAEHALDRAHLALQTAIKEIRDRAVADPNEVIAARLGLPEVDETEESQG